MLLLFLTFLAQITVPGVLSGPDPTQMETAPDLGYRPIEAGLKLPEGMKMGAPIDENGGTVLSTAPSQTRVESGGRPCL